MTPEEKKDLTAAVKAGVKAAHNELYIDPKQHYDDHGYIKGQRGAIKTVRKGSLLALGATILGFIVWIFQNIFTINTPTP